MRRIFSFSLYCIGFIFVVVENVDAQNNVGVNTNKPNPNAALEIKAKGKQGFLIPRLSASDTLMAPLNAASLTSQDKGLMFYDTVGVQFLYWSGTNWRQIGAGAGLKGEQGPIGPKGDLGPTGPQGPIGPAGAKGDQGDPGAAGPQGPIGLTGATGPQGPIGLTGAKGDPGTFSVAGVSGQTIYNDGSDWKATSNLFHNGTNVGIGTTLPKNKLDVKGGAVIGSSYAGINTANTNGLLVEGSVGIGTVSASHTFTVGKINASDTNNVRLMAYAGAGNKLLYIDNNGVVRDTNFAASGIWQRNAAKNFVYLTNTSDRIGIGTSSPSRTLHVFGVNSINDGSDGVYLKLHNSATGLDGISTGLKFSTYNSPNTSEKGGVFFRRTNGYGIGSILFSINDTYDSTSVNASDTYVKMSISSNGTITVPSLKGPGMVVSDANGSLSVAKSAFSAYALTLTALISSGWTPVLFDGEEYDNNGDFDKNVFTAPADGFYHFDASVGFVSGNSNKRYIIGLTVNGSLKKVVSSTGQSTIFSISINNDLKLTKGDEVNVQIYNGETSSVNTIASTYYTYFNGHRIF